MRKLRIAQLVPPFVEVPPKKYGGTELIAHHLTEGLVRRGHRVTLFASGDSKTKAKLISLFPEALYIKGISWQDPFSSLLHSISCFERAKEFDIIHNHSHYWGFCLSALVETKVITTYHGDFNTALEAKDTRAKILKRFKETSIVSISNSQRRVKGLKLNFVATIYNGIETTKFQFSKKPGKYLVWMGRITPKKGVVEAIEIAKRAGLPLKMAAKIDKNHQPDVDFYNTKVKPLIDGKKIKYIGEIGGYKQKSDFFKNAIALLNPIKWEEPFGLVMAEAMACGCPVVAFDRGSVKELIKDKKTGFVVKNIKEATEALRNIKEIKRSDCRSWCVKMFDKERMIDQYEKLYYKLLKK